MPQAQITYDVMKLAVDRYRLQFGQVLESSHLRNGVHVRGSLFQVIHLIHLILCGLGDKNRDCGKGIDGKQVA